MGPDKLEKVLERMGTTEETTLVVNRDIDGKMRVTSRHWEVAKVRGRNEVLGPQHQRPLHVVRKQRRPDEWDPPIEPYDPYGPGDSVMRHGGDELIDD